MDEYFDPGRKFAGSSFDLIGLENGTPDAVGMPDLLAVSLLDLPYPPNAVRQILGDLGPTISKRLRKIPKSRDLWLATDENLIRANELWETLLALPGVGPSRASKLLARKRPRLIPITDSVVAARLNPHTERLTEDLWVTLRAAFRADPMLKEDLRRVGTRQEAKVSVLRVLDAAIWMLHSDAAEGARERAKRCVEELAVT
jgi:hypothetical protein